MTTSQAPRTHLHGLPNIRASARRMLSALDSAQIDPGRAPDARRMLRDESLALRTAYQSGDAERLARAYNEASRVWAMWRDY